MVARLGREIDDPASICYWAQRNGIPIFCPALTDGSLGDMLFFHTYKNPGLVLDIIQVLLLQQAQAGKWLCRQDSRGRAAVTLEMSCRTSAPSTTRQYMPRRARPA